MKRSFAHYKHWEDVKCGLYSNVSQPEEKEVLSTDLLRNVEALTEAMKRTIIEWPVAARVNLSNASRNQRSWLGQACCCLDHGSNEGTVKKAWANLTDEEQNRANDVADRLITLWREEYAQDLPRR